MSLKKSQFRILLSSEYNSARISAGGELVLSKDDSHRIRNVLRKKEGAELSIIDPVTGRAFTAIVSGIEPQVTVKIVCEENEHKPRGKVGILACALIKGEKNELICEKACELGVRKIIFWQADRSIVKLDARDYAGKIKRLQKTIDGAARQSANHRPPSIEFVHSAAELVNSVKSAGDTELLTLFCSTTPGADEIAKLVQNAARVNIIIGPEGDLTHSEEQIFSDAGYRAASLGPFILRAETAAIAAVCAVNTVCGFEIES